MASEWDALTRLTGSEPIVIERVRLSDSGIALEGEFELPPLARLTAEDQLFVAAFVRCHGSIKQMEKYFGVSYPTIKNRLNRIGGELAFVEVEAPPTPLSDDVLGRIERGEMSVADALERLKGSADA
jgi:hypothetical protein